MDEIHLVKLGSAEKEEEWATAHFRFFVVTQNSLSQQRLLISRHDNGSSVATGQGLLGHNRAVRVETVSRAHAARRPWVRDKVRAHATEKFCRDREVQTGAARTVKKPWPCTRGSALLSLSRQSCLVAHRIVLCTG